MRNNTRMGALVKVGRIVVLAGLIAFALTGTAQARLSRLRAGLVVVKMGHNLSSVNTETAFCPSGVPVQTITVANQANVRPWALAKVENAVTEQSLQVRAAWGTPCVQFGPGGWPISLEIGGVEHNSDGSTSYSLGGHHDYIGGNPSAMVDTGGLTYALWARGFTHEVTEMLADPTLSNRWRFGLVEVCDPVEDLTYPVDGVQVSDFALPSYFSGSAGPWDEMHDLAEPIFTEP